LIYGVREHDLWRKIYILLDRSLLKVKQVIKNHIRVGKVNMLQHVPLYFYKENQSEKPSKWNYSPNINQSLRKNYEGLTYGHLVYPKGLPLI
jgi:hypothetical protein